MKFYSLHIGLNAVDPGHYQGWDGQLNACEADARSLQQLVLSLADARRIVPKVSYKTDLLLTKQATRAAVLERLAYYAQLCQSGDLFLLTYSGHGGQVPDLNGDEPDSLDETWALFDAQVIDDELYLAYSRFAAGVRVLILSDSCHSGSVNKATHYVSKSPADYLGDNQVNYQHNYKQGRVVASSYRNVPIPVVQHTFNANRAYYEDIMRTLVVGEGAARVAHRTNVLASVRLISGCADNQLSQDGIFNGLFTGVVLKVWNGGAFKGDYNAFHKAILAKMPPDQSPLHSVIGTADAAYDQTIPFTGMPAQFPPRHRNLITQVAPANA